jgi:hypothetical protein
VCTYSGARNEGQGSLNSSPGVEEHKESERRIVQVLSQDQTVRVVPPTAEEEVLRCLLCTATAVWAVHLVNAMKVGFVVAVSNLELVEGTGNLFLGAHWNDELLPGFPCKLCRICAGVPEDDCWGSADDSS